MWNPFKNTSPGWGIKPCCIFGIYLLDGPYLNDILEDETRYYESGVVLWLGCFHIDVVWYQEIE